MPLPDPATSGPDDGPNVATIDREAYAAVALQYAEWCEGRGESFPLNVALLMQRDVAERDGRSGKLAEIAAAITATERAVALVTWANTAEGRRARYRANKRAKARIEQALRDAVAATPIGGIE